MVHGHDPGPGVTVDDDPHGVWVRPQGDHDDRVALFAHGGGFVSSPATSYTFWGAHVARHCGLPVLIVDYRLAPETVFPGQLDDLAAAHDTIIEGGVDPARVVFFGDSCGGGLAVATILLQRDRGRPQPGAFVGLGGWYDLEATGVTSPWPDPFVDPDWLRLRARDYVGPAGDPADPLASVVNADLTGLAPMLLQTGEVDPCLPGARLLAEHAHRDGVEATVEVIAAVAQGFQGMSSVPEADQSWASVRRFVDHNVPPRS
ncbi:MAG: alpha/beta hydrolase [Acidimicrobiia bacterium]|nr:alpha/beta hydrolase [Acidimicrobiia bacterium]